MTACWSAVSDPEQAVESLIIAGQWHGPDCWNLVKDANGVARWVRVCYDVSIIEEKGA